MDDELLRSDGRGQNPVYQARTKEEAAIRAAWQGALENHLEHAEATSADL